MKNGLREARGQRTRSFRSFRWRITPEGNSRLVAYIHVYWARGKRAWSHDRRNEIALPRSKTIPTTDYVRIEIVTSPRGLYSRGGDRCFTDSDIHCVFHADGLNYQPFRAAWVVPGWRKGREIVGSFFPPFFFLSFSLSVRWYLRGRIYADRYDGVGM